MSKLDELINELCPDGVEYYSLENCCDYVDYRGKTPNKKDSGIFLITAKNIRQGYIDYESSKEYVSPEDYDEVMHRGLPQIGDVLFTTEAPCGYVAQIDREDVALAQRVIKFRGHKNLLNNTFLKYVLLGNEFQKELHKISTGATVEGIKGSRLHKMEIPVPPLEIQNEIVQTLDKFTSLEAELEAELEARRKQYEYYRDSLLTFGDDVEWKTLGELFEFKNGLNKEKDAFGKGKTIVNFTDVYNKRWLTKERLHGLVDVNGEEQKRYSAKKGDVFFTRTSETKEDVGMASVLLEDIEGCVFSGFVLRARPLTDLFIPKFYSYYFSTPQVRRIIVKYASFTTRALTSGPRLAKIKIPLISKEEQERIVSILDRFESLCNDITSGLPAEIEARHKQYEYYRDTLLTFKRKGV